MKIIIESVIDYNNRVPKLLKFRNHQNALRKAGVVVTIDYTAYYWQLAIHAHSFIRQMETGKVNMKDYKCDDFRSDFGYSYNRFNRFSRF